MASASLALVKMRYPHRLGVAGLDMASAGAYIQRTVVSFQNLVSGYRRADAHLLTYSHSFIMVSFLVLGFSTIVAGAAIQQRDPVPAGYVAAPYYPGMSLEATSNCCFRAESSNADYT
jgi:hypothetical protein